MPYLYGGVKIPDDLREEHATVVRTMPDGTRRFMYPIYDRATAERAIENLDSAKPPLSRDEMRAVIERALVYITGRRRRPIV